MWQMRRTAAKHCCMLQVTSRDVKSQQESTVDISQSQSRVIYRTFSQAELRMGLEAWQQMQPGNGHVADCWKQIFIEDQRLGLKGLKWFRCCDL